jgi:oligoendopeptidase F
MVKSTHNQPKDNLMPKTIPPRNKINKKHTWNAESVFKSAKEWEAELQSILKDIPGIKKYQGNLGTSPQTLLQGLQTMEALMKRVMKVYMYAAFSYNVDTTDQKAAGMMGKAQGMFGQVAGAISFINPELLQIGKATLDDWMKKNEKLGVYRQSVRDLFRQQEHVRSSEVEELLGMLSDPMSGADNSTSMLVNADFKFAPAKDSKGRKVEVTQGNFTLPHGRPRPQSAPDRVRKLHGQAHRIQKYACRQPCHFHQNNVFFMRAREHNSTLEASLFNNNIPVEVFHNLINTFKKNLPVWHRYFEIRRKALKLREVTYLRYVGSDCKEEAKYPL